MTTGAPVIQGAGVDVVATIYPTDLDEVAAYFALFGFRPGPEASPGWRPLRARARSGEIGIETTEPLDVLAARLVDARHPVTVVDDSGPRHLVVTDPDGIDLEVYAAS